MKKSTHYLRILALFSLFLMAGVTRSQTLCTASFVYTNNPGGSVTFSSTSINTSSITNYNWSINTTPVTYTTGISPTYIFLANGVYTVSLQMVNIAPSCSSTAVQVVTVTNAACNINANFVFNQNSGNPNVSFNNTTTGAGAGVTYLWNFGDNSTSTSISPVHTYSTYGSYLVTLIANNNYTNTCVSTRTFLANYNSCAGGVAYTYSANTNGNISFYSSSPQASTSSVYNWTFGNNTSFSVVGTSSASATYSMNGNYYAMLRMTSPNCTASIGGTVLVTNTATPCNLAAGFFYNGSFNNFTSGANGSTTYSWNFGDNTTGTGFSPVHTYSASGNYTVTLVANNNTSPVCTSTVTNVINVTACNVNPIVSSYTYSIGGAGFVNFTSTSTNTNTNTNYVWNFGGLGVFSGTNLAQTSYTFPYNGTFIVNLQVVNSAPSCTASSSQSIAVTNASSCSLTAGFSYNNGIFNNSTYGTNGSTTYSWNFGDNTTGTGYSPVHTYSASGNYTVTLVANNNTSPACTSTISNVINVTQCNVNPILASFTYSIGTGGFVNFTSTSTNTNSGTNYVWYFQGLGTNSGTNLAQTSYTFPYNGSFIVNLQVINSVPSCTGTTTQTVTITNVSPCSVTAVFSYSQTGNTIQFFSQSTGTIMGTSYTWNFGDGTWMNFIQPIHTYSSNGIFVANLIVNNNSSPTCSASTSQTISINPNPPCNLSNAFTTAQGSSGLVNFFGSTAGTTSTTTYFWNFGNASTSTLSSPVHTFSANGIYTVTFITNNNSTPSCSITVTQVISVCSVNPPTAGFNYSVNPNGNVVFTSNSTNTTPSTIYYWNLNSSGTYSSASASYTSGVNLTQVSQTYTSGSYGAYLYVTNISPGCTVSSTGSYQTFTVLPPCNLTASYSFTQALSGLVNFNSTSTGTSTGTVFNWNFGDNTTGAGSVVSHSYAANGTYIATLSVNAPGFSSPCIGTATQTIVINNICVANAGFSLAPTATAQVWNVNLTSPTNVTAAIWSWGDGTTTNALFTSHSYSAAGNYFICLSVTVSCGSSASSCNTYAIYRGTGNNQNDGIIQVDVVDPSNPTAIPSLNKTSTESEVIISPNPNQGSFMINFIEPKSDHSDIRIFDVTGKLIVEQSIVLNSANATKEINLKDVPNGLYFLQTKCGDQTVNKKILIEK